MQTVQPPMLKAPQHEEEALCELRVEIEKALTRACPWWLASEREDLVQMCMIRLLEVSRQDAGDPDTGGSRTLGELGPAYLRKVAWNQVIDEIRRRKRRPESSLEQIAEAASLQGATPSPERMMSSRQLGCAIRACLKQLIGPRRVAVTLTLLGHSYREIADLQGWEVKRVENLVLRGRADLRTCLESQGFGR